MSEIAVLTDLNGTLDRAERIRQELWRTACFEVLGFQGEADIFKASLGLAGKDVIPAVGAAMREAGYSNVTDEDVGRVYKRRNIILENEGYEAKGYPFREGAVELLRELHGFGFPIAIVTSETEAHAMRSAERNGIKDLIAGVVGRDTKVDGNELKRKPDSMPYDVAARRIEEHREAKIRFVAMEDTAPGMFAALTSRPVEDLVHSRDIQGSWDIAKQMERISGGMFSQDELLKNIALQDADFGQIAEFFREMRKVL